jgi:hypothetical protein
VAVAWKRACGGIIGAVVWLLAHGALAEPRVEELVLVGTITSIFTVHAPPPSRRNWGVTVRVDKVKLGNYSEPTFTFTIHSPARSGVKVGLRCTIVATKTGPQEYLVSDTRRIECDAN